MISKKHEDYLEYALIKYYYGERTANRSKVPFINHIHEGIYVLNCIGASENAVRAFCLHPLPQGDTELESFYYDNLDYIHRDVLILAMEYRNIANQYLSYRKIKSIDEISLSPLKEVNEMLIADKIQNYKDFLIYHKDTHQRSDEIDEYFRNWLAKLEIYDFYAWFESIQTNCNPSGCVIQSVDEQ